MADTNDEQVGRINFSIQKAGAVERALGKVRHHLGDDWTMLSFEEISLLDWLLGEIWTTVDFLTWDTLGFNYLDLQAVDRLTALAKEIRSGQVSLTVGLKQASGILGRL